MNKKERAICKFEINFKKSFCWRSNLLNLTNFCDTGEVGGGGGLCYTGHKVPSPRVYFLCRLGLKTGIDFTDLFWSGIGYGRYGF